MSVIPIAHIATHPAPEHPHSGVKPRKRELLDVKAG
jgi:hypothetical protein